MRKTVADIAAEVVREMGYPALTVGDNACMDRIVFRVQKELGINIGRYNPRKYPEHYQVRIIDALAHTKRGQELFETRYTRTGGHQGTRRARLMVPRESDGPTNTKATTR